MQEDSETWHWWYEILLVHFHITMLICVDVDLCLFQPANIRDLFKVTGMSILSNAFEGIVMHLLDEQPVLNLAHLLQLQQPDERSINALISIVTPRITRSVHRMLRLNWLILSQNWQGMRHQKDTNGYLIWQWINKECCIELIKVGDKYWSLMNEEYEWMDRWIILIIQKHLLTRMAVPNHEICLEKRIFEPLYEMDQLKKLVKNIINRMELSAYNVAD